MGRRSWGGRSRSSGGGIFGGRSSGGTFGGGLFSSRKRPAAASTPSRKTPASVAPAPPPAPVQGGGSAMGDFGSGMAGGAGCEIGSRAVDAMVGPRVVRYEVVGSPAPVPESATMSTSSSLGDHNACDAQFKAFEDCLTSYRSEVGKCQFYMDMLTECRKNSSAGLMNA